MREWVRYAVALIGYIGLAMLTKQFLTWTWGPIYFVVMLEALPRLLRRIRNWRAARSGLPRELVLDP
jgi:hypothetical protein